MEEIIEKQIDNLFNEKRAEVDKKFKNWYNAKVFFSFRKVKRIKGEKLERSYKKIIYGQYVSNQLLLIYDKKKAELKAQGTMKAFYDKRIEYSKTEIKNIQNKNSWRTYIPILQYFAEKNKERKIARENSKIEKYKENSKNIKDSINENKCYLESLGLVIGNYDLEIKAEFEKIKTDKNYSKLLQAPFLKESKKNRKIIALERSEIVKIISKRKSQTKEDLLNMESALIELCNSLKKSEVKDFFLSKIERISIKTSDIFNYDLTDLYKFKEKKVEELKEIKSEVVKIIEDSIQKRLILKIYKLNEFYKKSKIKNSEAFKNFPSNTENIELTKKIEELQNKVNSYLIKDNILCKEVLEMNKTHIELETCIKTMKEKIKRVNKSGLQVNREVVKQGSRQSVIRSF